MSSAKLAASALPDERRKSARPPSKQETADVLKPLEVIDRPDIPAYMGTETPLFMDPTTPLRLRLYGGSRTDPLLGRRQNSARGRTM